MAVINLATNYADKIGQRYIQKSVIADISLPQSDINFDGSKTVVVTTPRTVPLNDYRRSGTWRYGEVNDVGNDVQAFTLGFDKAFTTTFDKGNKSDSKAITKAAAQFLTYQLDEEVTPTIDKTALYRIAHDAGRVFTTAEAPSEANILSLVNSGSIQMSNDSVATADRVLIMGWSMYGFCRLNNAILGVDKMGEAALAKGDVGELFGMKVRCVPDAYMPSNAYFMIIQKQAAFVAQKIQEAKVHTDPPGISGDLIEGRYYFDAFVRAEKCNGVYVLAKDAQQFATPAPTVSGKTFTIASVPSGGQALYTLDGSDPRYSKTAQVYSSAVTASAGDTFKAAITPVRAVNETPSTLFSSDVYEKAV